MSTSSGCLNKIIFLKKVKAALHSCLLVNRIWCEVSRCYIFINETFDALIELKILRRKSQYDFTDDSEEQNEDSFINYSSSSETNQTNVSDLPKGKRNVKWLLIGR
ncbi:hypothetical protein RCL_jg18001.t1 [Rhizophagus clarus]|uniref:Uncharacterized protein n=1 Tax=Rhizophagus clarus TaxID=94130 RepID=A0A8H3L8D2_9GLOM|nr:hypothetical protein RCL_jg18001.t1 [Rhizophagus clarus]